jgi:hypothetical protein
MVTSAERKVGKGSTRLGAVQGGTTNARSAVASRRRRRGMDALLPMWLLAAWALCCFPVAGGASYSGGGVPSI